jgi:hypothetical protein
MSVIDELAAMDDKALMAKLGLSTQLEDFKSALKRAKALPDKDQKAISDSLKRQLEPHIYPSELKYQVDRAERKAKGKSDDGPCGCLQGVVEDY